MATLTSELKSRIEETADPYFKITRANSKVLHFESVMFKHNDFILCHEHLSDNEILSVAEILRQVFNEFPLDYQADVGFPPKRKLNNLFKFSAKFVRSVLNVRGSALHKFLLLTSGERLLSKDNFSLAIILAQNKKECCSVPEAMGRNKNLFRALKDLYIIPGISRDSLPSNHTFFEVDAADPSSLNWIARLAAFIANNSDCLTFSEQLQLEFVEAIQVGHAEDNLRKNKSFKRILLSEYRKLADLMTARELESLSYILGSETVKKDFPRRILRNRSVAMSRGNPPHSRMGSNIVLRYLSPDEKSAFDESSSIDGLDSFLENAEPYCATPSVVYAAMAEVLVVKGERKAFEVARELVHLRFTHDDFTVYEATVGLISEALKPENDELPFGWAAQVSEHSWVLTSHLSCHQELAFTV